MITTELTETKHCITVFKTFSKPLEDISLLDIINRIKNGAFKQEIENIRESFLKGDTERTDSLKKKLIAFTPSASFSKGRKLEFLNQYNGIIHLDFDKLQQSELDNIFDKIIAIPYTLFCFRSPRNNGFKVFIKTNAEATQHTDVYKQVQKFYEDKLNIIADSSCKDISRLCFVYYDPNTYINDNPQLFNLFEKPQNKASSFVSRNANEYTTLFERCKLLTEKKLSYINGNRNNYIYLLASNCNRAGIPENEAISLISSNYDLAFTEISKSVNSAFSNHIDEFAKLAKFANLQTNSSNDSNFDFLKNTPFIPDDVISLLPEVLNSGCSAFSDRRERDVFLTGAIAILSGCLPGVSGIYAQKEVYPNLFSFIIAPAASGKGAMDFSKMLAEKEHERIINISKQDEKKYNSELRDFLYRQRFRKKSEGPEDPPEKPPFKVLFIPANTSYAKILSHMDQNNGSGIICETEADTMGNVLKQDWGSYSDMLRKAFHHERISSSKKTNNEYIEVPKPRISIALSGTPSQVMNLIVSSEDGLFSRFIFYVFKVDQVWRDVSPFANNINLTAHLNDIASDIVKLVEFLNIQETIIKLTKSQWDLLNETCKNWLTQVVIFSGEDSASIVKRLGLIIYRIAMIFTSLRKFENAEMSHSIICSETDFKTAIKLAQIYLDHSIFMFHNLQAQDKEQILKSGNYKQHFFDALPESFKRAEAVALGKKHRLSERSVDSFLKQLLGKYLTQEAYGQYSKF